MSDGLNAIQRNIAVGAGVALVLMFLFPPMSIERRIPGLTDGTNQYALQMREFDGWGFIAQVDPADPPRPRPKDPQNLTPLERFMAADPGPVSVEEVFRGKKRVDSRILLIEIGSLAMLTVAALLVLRSRR